VCRGSWWCLFSLDDFWPVPLMRLAGDGGDAFEVPVAVEECRSPQLVVWPLCGSTVRPGPPVSSSLP